MLKFTSADDLARLPKTDPAYPIIEDLVKRLITDTYDTEFPYSEDGDGFIALIEPGDTERALTEIWADGDWGLTDIPWEGITYQDGFYLAIFLANNSYGIVFVIPDEDWVKGELRECILKNLDPPLNEHPTSTGENYD
ncbi:MAG: hypothetical protein KAS23_08270 [Anaerohalosphaera sp.]|nr:hypothetical protein [Anaerohalosphaera sp.]